MRVPKLVRAAALSVIILASGGAQAAYPTPGAEEISFQVHPVPMLDSIEVLDGFLSHQSGEGYSLVADPRTGSIVAVAPSSVQHQLSRYIERRTAERMRRYVVNMKVTQQVAGVPRQINPPRQEVPYGEAGVLNLDGPYRPGGPDWRSSLTFRPEPDDSGRIKLHIHTGGTSGESKVVVMVRPGEDLVIDEHQALVPELRELARQLNSSNPASPYSVRLSVAPL